MDLFLSPPSYPYLFLQDHVPVLSCLLTESLHYLTTTSSMFDSPLYSFSPSAD
jgi:hypothetical protein